MDDADITGERMELEDAVRQRHYREAAAAIPVGAPGDCELCGEWSGRLVGSACAPCRTKYKLP